MNSSLKVFEKCFTVFSLIFFTGMLSFDSLYISPDPKADASNAYNPIYPLLSIVQLLIYGITTLLLLMRWRSTIKTALSYKAIWGIIFLVLLSFLWSDFPEISLRKGINAFQTSLFGLYMASRFTLKEQLRLLAYALSTVAIISLLFSFAFRGAAIEDGANAGAWRGPFTQKNLTARIMMLSLIACTLAIVESKKYRLLLWTGCFTSFILIVLSGSKTGLLVLLTIAALLPLYRMLRWKTTIVIPLVILVILTAGSLGMMLISNWESLLLSLGRDPSLSGRTELWEAAIEKIIARPLLGYGFQGFWQNGGESVSIWQAVQYKPPHAHNGYINISLDLGLMGLALFTFTILSLYLRGIALLRVDRSTAALLPVVYATFFFMYNHSENTIVEHNSIFWVLLISMSLSIRKSSRSQDADYFDKDALQPA